MRKDFTFKSVSRDDVAYEWISNYNSHENGFFRAPGTYIFPEANEFKTFGDGMTQHSPAWAVHADNIADFMASLAIFINDNMEYVESIAERWPSDGINLDRIRFYQKLKHDPESIVYYHDLEMKTSKNDKKRHDKRWSHLPEWADGSLTAVFLFLVKTFEGAGHRYALYQELRRALDHAWADPTKLINWIGFDLEDDRNRHLRQAYDTIDCFVQGYRQNRNGQSQLSCLIHNMRLDEPAKEESIAA